VLLRSTSLLCELLDWHHEAEEPQQDEAEGPRQGEVEEPRLGQVWVAAWNPNALPHQHEQLEPAGHVGQVDRTAGKKVPHAVVHTSTVRTLVHQGHDIDCPPLDGMAHMEDDEAAAAAT
jgi:hypothetical protein